MTPSPASGPSVWPMVQIVSREIRKDGTRVHQLADRTIDANPSDKWVTEDEATVGRRRPRPTRRVFTPSVGTTAPGPAPVADHQGDGDAGGLYSCWTAASMSSSSSSTGSMYRRPSAIK